jgi:hypothetical protein
LAKLSAICETSMWGVVIAGGLATALLVPLLRSRRWKRLARNLYNAHRITYQEAPRWEVVNEDDAEAWREERLSVIAAELGRFGFRGAGLIHNARDDRFHGGERHALTIFIREQGDVHAASRDASGHDILELETEFTDGQVLCTADFPFGARLSDPPEIEIANRPGVSPSDLFREHQERIRARARSSKAQIRPAHSLDDVIASQVRQHALRRNYRLPLAYIADAEFEKIADQLGLSRWGRRVVLEEYRALAANDRPASMGRTP